jgi:membrane protein implicated in regulation of membrane protease activity
MATWRNYWEKVKRYRDHVIFVGLSLLVGGISRELKPPLLQAFVILLFIILSSYRFGMGALILAFIASAISTEGMSSDKRSFIVLFFMLIALVLGWFMRRRRRNPTIVGEMVSTEIVAGKKGDVETQEEAEKKKIPYEKEVPCKFCGRLISKAELECPYCRKKQYDLHEINTLLEKKSRIREALDNLELRFMNGEVDDETYKSLKKKWNVRLADIEEKIISSQMKH